MRHSKIGRKFHRESGQRQALLRSLASNMILKEKIKTTEPKAKELRRYIEKLVTKAKTDSLASRRIVAEKLGSSLRVNKLFKVIGPRYADRKGGYTRIIKLPNRVSDDSAQAYIEFV